MLLTATLSLLLMQQAPAENVDWDAEFGVEEVERDPATGEIPVESYEQKNENAGAKNIFEHGNFLQKVVKIFYLLWDPEIDLKDNQDEGSRSNSDQA